MSSRLCPLGSPVDAVSAGIGVGLAGSVGKGAVPAGSPRSWIRPKIRPNSPADQWGVVLGVDVVRVGDDVKADWSERPGWLHLVSVSRQQGAVAGAW